MTLRDRIIAAAESQIGVRETARNRGPEVDEYQRACGHDPATSEIGGLPWCVAFAAWCCKQAAAKIPVTMSGMRLLSLARKRGAVALQPSPGDIFVIDKGKGRSHVGIVAYVLPDGHMCTIEGNTDPGGSREGDGVYMRTDRRVDACAGFVTPTWAPGE